MLSYISNSVEQTTSFANDFSKKLVKGNLVGLCGPLGSGKTHFVKAILSNFDKSINVNSPTFNIINEYNITAKDLQIAHFDFYRIKNIYELYDIGWQDYISGDYILLIEWADKFKNFLPNDANWITFSIVNDSTRKIDIN